MYLLETYGVGWTYEDTQGMYGCIFLFLLYLLRNTSPIFRTIWDVVKIFIIFVLIIVFAGMILKWIKKFL